MTTAIKKLIGHIDLLVTWLNENPGTQMPSQEKKRLTTILNKIIHTEAMSDEEWEQIKPKQKPISYSTDSNFWTNFKRAITSSRKSQIKKPNASKKTIPLPVLPPKKSTADNFVINNPGKKMIICPACQSRVLDKNLKRHKKKCKPP